MPEEESTEEFELSYCKVSEGTGLSAFFPHDANADVSSLNHIDIVRTVTDCQSCLILADALNECHEGCLLLGRRAIHDEAFRLSKGIDKRLATCLVSWCTHLHDSVDEDLDSCSTDHEIFIDAT